MWKTSLIPFIAQALVMCFDEFYFHVRRGLPKWERIGHPLDTLTVIACMAYVLFVPFSSHALFLYILLAIFSTLFVTKDEFVHKHHCPASEQWLHALLFTLHPITLGFAGFIWPVTQGVEVAPWIAHWLNHETMLRQFLIMQLGAMTLFLCYQVIFWNWIYAKKVHDQQ
jgi:hypothetical protein